MFSDSIQQHKSQINIDKSALSKIFHVKGSNVDFISEMCEQYCFETEDANRQDRFCRKLAIMNSPLFIPFIDSHDWHWNFCMCITCIFCIFYTLYITVLRCYTGEIKLI